MTGAFTAERLEMVQLLSSQIGISFENASLYKDLQNANAELETKNKALIALDYMKDQFLANTSHELRCDKEKRRELRVQKITHLTGLP